MNVIKSIGLGSDAISGCLDGFSKRKEDMFSSALNIKKMISDNFSEFTPLFRFIIDLFLFISFMPLIPFFYIIAVGIYTAEYIGLKLQKL